MKYPSLDFVVVVLFLGGGGGKGVTKLFFMVTILQLKDVLF